MDNPGMRGHGSVLVELAYRVRFMENIKGKLKHDCFVLGTESEELLSGPQEVRGHSASDSGGKGVFCFCHRRKRITVQMMLKEKD